MSSERLLYKRNKITLGTFAKHDINVRLWFSGDENFMFWNSLSHIKDEMLIIIFQTACMVFQSSQLLL